jgi:hypothetical protein
VTNGDELKKHFLNEIPKLRELQEILLSKGKYFVVVIGSSKPYVYPEGLGTRFLVGGDVGIFDRAVSFGDALKGAGVNVIDSGPLLREFRAATGIPTHPESGVHWNYYAGCVVARTLLDKARTSRLVQAPIIDCGSPTFTIPKMVDNDGLFLMNIWSRGGLTKTSPYPNIRSQVTEGHRSNIVFIGDSFSDQIRYSFQEGKVFSKLTMSNYFRTRAVFEQGSVNAEGDGSTAQEETIRRELMEDIRFADIVVLQMVDYNVIRWGYGFPDYLLKQQRLLD